MKKTRLLMFVCVLILSLLLVGMALAADSAQKPKPDNVNSTGLPPAAEGGGIDSLSGSYVVFDPAVGGDSCFAAGSPQTFCFRAESYTNDWEYVYDIFQKFDTDWTVTDVYVQGTPVCDSGTWGSFSWYYVNDYEIDLYHPRYQSTTDHCVAYYCFEVVSGASDGNESWYWTGDGYGSVPHHPCSDDGYTPSGYSACDEAVQPTAYIPPCEPGIYLTPDEQSGSACGGESVVYTLNLFNNSGDDGTFDLTYDSMFPIDGPEDLFVADGATEPFEVSVMVPCGETSDTATVTADGNGFSDSAMLETTLSEGGWETVPDSAPSWAGGGYPRDGCTAMNADGDWVSYEIGDVSGITGFWGYNLDTNTWYQPAPSGLPADRWAPDWAYDPETNLCYMTGGANTPGGGTYNTAYVFDPIANTFTQLGDFTSMRDFHTSWIGVLDGVKYLCIGGGVDFNSILMQATQCYDLNQALPGTWNAENAQMAALPTDPFGAADGVYHAASGDQFWYIGGAIENFATVTDQVYTWDDADDAWHLLGNTGVPRYRVEGDFFNGNYYQLGGSSGGFTYTGDIVKGTFNGATWDWTNEGQLVNSRMDNVVAVSPDSIWSIDGYGESSSDYVEYLFTCPECGTPIIGVDPLFLEQDLFQDYQTADQTLYVCNEISATMPLDWELIEAQAAPPLLAPTNPDTLSVHPVELSLDSHPGSGILTNVPAIPADGIELMLDDGSVENNIGLNDSISSYQYLWFNRFTPDPADFPFNLTQIQVLFDTGVGVAIGDEIELVVYEDMDGDEDPSNATLLSDYAVTVQAADGVTWSAYELPSPLELTGPGDVLIGVINRFTESGVSPPAYPSALDTNASQLRSWVAAWSTDPPEPPVLPPDNLFGLIDSFGFPGNWLIRGYGEQMYDIPWLSEEPLFGTLEPGVCQPITVTFDSLDLPLGEYFDLLKVFSNDPMTPEVTVPVTLNVVGQADLGLTKMASAEEVRVNDLITYTLEVSNIGPDTAMNVVVTDTLPAEVTFKSSEACYEDMGMVYCELGDLDTGAITLTIVVTATQDGMAVNMAEVGSDTSDPNPENNMAETDVAISPAMYYFYLPIVQKH
jgi:uncharacterized repeat protein (TIGR01451 family)